MALFFYRAWAGEQSENRGGVRLELTPDNPLYYTRYGYAALLGITLFGGLLLNGIYLLGYLVCPRALIQVPHAAIASLALRDLLVCLFVLPASLDWLLAGLTSWPGGEMWCQTAVFFDYYLNFLHPLFILMLCTILYTRKLPPKLPTEGIPYQTPAPPIDSRLSSRSGYTRQTPYRPTDISQVATSVRAPSVVNSVRAPSVLSGSSGRHGGQGDFRKGFSKAGGSTPRSHGSVSGGSFRGAAVPSVSGSVTVSGSVVGRGRGRANFSPPPQMNSTMMSANEEEFLDHEDGELWELASMEYPGKADGTMDLQEEDEDFDPDEPRLREWLKYLVALCWLLGLGIGLPAALSSEYAEKIPNGCFIKPDKALLARSRNNAISQDPVLNFFFATTAISYILPSLLMILMAILLRTTRWTQDGKLNRFYKLAIALCVLFIATKSPVEISSFIDLIHTNQLFAIVNKRPDELEREILFIWVALMPVVGNPIIYLFCVTEYRSNIKQAWRACIGGSSDEKEEFADLKTDDANALTKESDIM